ncbi:MAG: hypothetical protein EOM06_11995 [Sphingobacteriia bacterium]|nr:hypothetical protein [Sphingobacteriia bacterium]
MKTKIFFTVVMAIFMAIVSNANVWRVNNISGSGAHFTGITEANNSTMVQPGDTLYIEPSATTYALGSLTKPLTIIGNGYFLAENPETQANTNTSKIEGIYFQTGSSGSAVMGCALNGTSYIYVSNIRIERNYINSTLNIWANNLTDILIIGNFINATIGSSNYIGINNVLISGNFIEKSAGTAAITFGPEVSAVIENNVIQGIITINNSIFSNNILRAGSFNATNTAYYNNIGNDNQFGAANGNQQYVNMEDVFVGTGSTDGKWQLKTGSPAIGAGTAGQDCGMFDGTHPYKLSGLPSIPSIYEYLQIYNSEAQEIEVNFSVKSQN